MMKKNLPILSIVLFVLAGLLIIYSAWAFINCRNYISEAISAGQLVTNGNEYDIVNFYMANVAQYILFAVLFIAVGWLLHKLSTVYSEVPVESAVPAPRVKDDDNFNEWVEEMKQDEGNQKKD